MLVSLKWLDSMVKVPDDLQDFCDRLDLTGTGVEGVEALGADLEGVKIGLVKTCEPHPDSDHMSVTTIDFGDGARADADRVRCAQRTRGPQGRRRHHRHGSAR